MNFNFKWWHGIAWQCWLAFAWHRYVRVSSIQAICQFYIFEWYLTNAYYFLILHTVTVSDQLKFEWQVKEKERFFLDLFRYLTVRLSNYLSNVMSNYHTLYLCVYRLMSVWHSLSVHFHVYFTIQLYRQQSIICQAYLTTFYKRTWRTCVSMLASELQYLYAYKSYSNSGIDSSETTIRWT